MAEDGEHPVVTERAHAYLEAWLAALAKSAPHMTSGPIFRHIDRWNNVRERALSGEAVNGIVKRTAAAVGIDPKKVSAHGLRAGYLTEAS